MTFTVTYRAKDGALREERIEAASRAGCVAECRKRGIAPTKIAEGGKSRHLGGGGACRVFKRRVVVDSTVDGYIAELERRQRLEVSLTARTRSRSWRRCWRRRARGRGRQQVYNSKVWGRQQAYNSKRRHCARRMGIGSRPTHSFRQWASIHLPSPTFCAPTRPALAWTSSGAITHRAKQFSITRAGCIQSTWTSFSNSFSRTVGQLALGSNPTPSRR